MKFQVGDKVRVKTMQELAALYGKPHQGYCGAMVIVSGGYNFVSGMEQFGGTVQAVTEIYKDEGYRLGNADGRYIFTDAMLDRVGV